MATERTVLVRLKADVNPFVRGMAEAAAATKGLTHEINTSNDRTAWLTQGILALAPAAVRLGAGAVPAVAGIATQMTVAAAATGVLVLGFHGVGQALKALNDYQMDPTAEHLKKLQQTMQQIGPAGEEFVRFLDTLQPKLAMLANTSRAGMFPGIEQGLTSMMTLMPEVRKVVVQLAAGIGELAKEGGQNLAGPKFQDFFKWLETDARPILLDMGRTAGNVFEGLTNLFLAFAPESRSFSHGLLEMSRSFAEWSRTLDTNQSFQDFLHYVDSAGPQALAFLEQLIRALAAFAGAAAPVGSVMLPALTELLKVFAQLASTPFGSTLIALGAAMSVYGRAVAIGSNLTTGLDRKFGMINATALRTTFSLKAMTAETGTWARAAGRVGGQVALTGIAVSGVADKFGLANTASLAMAGSLAGPWGAAIGGGVGLALDFMSSQHKSAAATADFTSTLNQQTGAITENTKAMAAKALQDDGAFEAANKLGLNLHTVTEAALGNKQAMSELNGELAFYLNQKQPGYSAGGYSVVDPQEQAAARKIADEIGAIGGRVKVSRAAVRQLSEAIHGNATSADHARAAHARLAMALKTERAAAQTTADQFNNLGNDVDNAKVSLDKWIHQLAKQAQALRDFGNNARRAADRGLKQGLIDQLNELGPTGALRMKQLANGTQEQIGRANHAWGSLQQSMKDYVNLRVPPKKVDVDTAAGLAHLRELAVALASIRSKTITVTTQHATGGSVKGGFATGGFTGWDGGKYDPAGIVHKRELVLPEEVVRADWSFLKARYGYLPGFADGGLVGMPARGGGGSTSVRLTVDEIPMRGTVEINTGAFVGMARVVARSEIDADRDFDQKREHQ